MPVNYDRCFKEIVEKHFFTGIILWMKIALFIMLIF